MKGEILAIIFLLISTSFLPLHAQWAFTFGESDDEYSSSIQQTDDGGYIILGNLILSGAGEYESDDYYIRIVKFKSDGNIEWQKTYGISSWFNRYSYSIQQTKDGGYIVGGCDEAYNNRDNKFWIIKLASDGDILWQKDYIDISANYDYFLQLLRSLVPTSEGGFIAVGACGPNADGDYDIFVVKLIFDGTIEWQNKYGGSEYESANSIRQTNDGGYILAGESQSFGAGNSDIWILKLAADGFIEWQKTYGGSKNEGAKSIQQTIDGGYVIAGSSTSFGSGGLDVWIMKISPDGKTEWQKTFGGSQREMAYSIQQTIDGGFIVAAETNSFGSGKKDIWIIKLNTVGNIEWQKTYGGNQDEEASSIQQTYDGGYVVSGSTASYGAGDRDFMILKLNSDGGISPSCTFINESDAKVSETDIVPSDTYIETEYQDLYLDDLKFTLIERDPVFYNLCSGQSVLSITASSGGTTEPEPGTHSFDYAERISLSAIPDTGYKFIGWSGDISSTDRAVSLTMDSDKSLQANFELDVIEEVWERVKRFRCFIATAAYGSPTHPHVQTLQDFRDKYLISSKLGRRFINLYYKYSPKTAEFITKHNALRTIVRIWLLPAVALGYSMVHLGPVITAFILALIFSAPFLFVWVYRRRSEGV